MLAKGVKRSHGEMEGEDPEPRDPGAAPASALLDISMLKLHQSLRHVEPDLRHLVLVANTLRRMQGHMQLQAGGPSGQQPPSPGQGGDLLLSTMDASLCSSISTLLEDLGQLESLSPARPEEEQLLAGECGTKPEPAPGHGPLDLLSSASYLTEDGLEDIFEDIDTSMYDCDLWSPTSLSGFKAFPGAEGLDSKALAGAEGRLDMSDLDYLMDVLVGGHGL
nr:SERTA domain-containing protein 1 [Pelodiscus sinensis]|eukprot:XP_025042934.1 SERTA domain-containing protein 1 [Pelodiscus sinensis]